MKFVRKPVVIPKPEPTPEPKREPAVVFDMTPIRELAELQRQVLHTVAMNSTPEHKPMSFSCTVTSRDAKGRIATFDVDVNE